MMLSSIEENRMMTSCERARGTVGAYGAAGAYGGSGGQD